MDSNSILDSENPNNIFKTEFEGDRPSDLVTTDLDVDNQDGGGTKATSRVLSDGDLNELKDNLYMTPKMLQESSSNPDYKWKRIMKYYVAELSKNSIDKNYVQDLSFYLERNRDLYLFQKIPRTQTAKIIGDKVQKDGSEVDKNINSGANTGNNSDCNTDDNNNDTQLTNTVYTEKKVKLNMSRGIRKIIFLLLCRTDSVDKYRIQISLSQKSWGYNVYLKIFMNQDYVRHLCSTFSYAPEILESLIKDRGSRYETFKVTTKDIEPALNEQISDSTCGDYLQDLDITPFMYQKNNVDWMYSIEKKTELSLNNYNYLMIRDLLNYKFNDFNLYMDPISNILYNEESLWNYEHGFSTTNFKGGVICDEVGLGKTLSMVSLILKNPKAKRKIIAPVKKKLIIAKKKIPQIKKKTEVTSEQKDDLEGTDKKNSNSPTSDQLADNDKSEITSTKENVTNDQKADEKKEEKLPESRATIIFCPSRLCQQWEDELNKYLKSTVRTSFKVIKITTKPQLEKCTVDDLCEADMVIVSYPFLANKNYYVYQEQIRFTKIHWHRVIIDEGHEVLLPNARKMAEVQTCKEILNLPSTYRWCCTGDPLARTRESFEGILAFLSGTKWEDVSSSSIIPNLNQDVAKDIIKNYFRRNTKKSTKDQIYIPQIQEDIRFLDFSPTERAVYNNAKGNPTRMMQLCTNILISDYDSNIIGNRVVNMNEINDAMCDHFKEQVIEIKKKIAANKAAAEKLEIEYPIELQDFDDRIAVYTDMKKKKIQLSDLEEEDLKELKENRQKLKTSYNYRKKAFVERLKALEKDLEYTYDQIKLFTGLNVEEITKEPCPVCQDKFKEVIITKCGHIFCQDCCSLIFNNNRKYANCPFCRENMQVTEMKKAVNPQTDKDNKDGVNKDDGVNKSITGQDSSSKSDTSGESDGENDKCSEGSDHEKDEKDMTEDEKNLQTYKIILNRWGTKMSQLVKYLHDVFKDPTNRVIIFSQWNKMLYMVGNVLDESGINHVYCRGNVWTITKSITRFKRDPSIRVIMLSSETCSSGNNLTEASHVILLDTANTSKENALAIENQAVGRAVRLGQKKAVQVVRMIIKDTIEEEYYKRNYLGTGVTNAGVSDDNETNQAELDDQDNAVAAAAT